MTLNCAGRYTTPSEALGFNATSRSCLASTRRGSVEPTEWLDFPGGLSGLCDFSNSTVQSGGSSIPDISCYTAMIHCVMRFKCTGIPLPLFLSSIWLCTDRLSAFTPSRSWHGLKKILSQSDVTIKSSGSTYSVCGPRRMSTSAA